MSRLKSNYQLAELVKVEGYPALIATIAKFTVTSLQVCSPIIFCCPDMTIGWQSGRHLLIVEC
jgi:hypothetical protein